eukprot:scaffold231849_cov18-Prasinocladus_malaysianus.AAC.1
MSEIRTWPLATSQPVSQTANTAGAIQGRPKRDQFTEQRKRRLPPQNRRENLCRLKAGGSGWIGACTAFQTR